MNSYFDSDFLHLMQCCPSISVIDLMRVDQVLQPLQALSLATTTDNTTYNAPASIDKDKQTALPADAPSTTVCDMDDYAKDVAIEHQHSPPPIDMDTIPLHGYHNTEISSPEFGGQYSPIGVRTQDIEESRLEDYVYYDLDVEQEVHCGSLFGGDSGSKGSTAGRAPVGISGDTTDGAAIKTTTPVTSNHWKLTINMCGNNRRSALSSSNSSGEKGNSHGSDNTDKFDKKQGTVQLVSIHICTVLYYTTPPALLIYLLIKHIFTCCIEL